MKTSARLALGAILLAHVALSLGFNFVTPIFEGPDEPNHFLFIRYLQVEHALPVQGMVKDAVRAHHPPAYFALDALLTQLAPAPASVTADFASLGLQTNPRYWFRFDDPEPDNKSVFLHFGAGEQWPYSGLPLTVHVARLLSLAFTLLAVGLTFAAAGHLRPGDTRFAALAAGLVAFNPMVLFMSGVVQNDAAALAAGAAVLATLGWVLRRRQDAARGQDATAGQDVPPGRLYRWWWLAVGVVYAAGILLKAGLLVMAAPIGLVALYAAGQAGAGWRPKAQALLWAGLAVALPVIVIDGWWFARNQVLYGDWTANASIVALWGPLSAEAQRQFLPLAIYSLATGMLGRFGNGGIIDFSQGAYWTAGILAAAGLAGAARLALQFMSHRDARAKAVAAPAGGDAAPPRLYGDKGAAEEAAGEAMGEGRAQEAMGEGLTPAAVLWAAHGLTIGAVAASVLVFALEFDGGATGKYLFPMFPSLALVLAAGALAWFPARWSRWAAAGLVGLSLAASGYAVFGLLLPAFGPPRQPLPGEMNGASALEADLGGDARLLAYRLDRQTVRPGDTLRVTVYWLPEADTTAPYTVFVHLYNPDVGTVAQRDLYPGGGTYRTTVWQAGRPFVDTYYLHVPPEAPATDAQILIGLYDEKTGERLTATGADAGPPGSDWIQFGQVKVVKP